MPILYHGTCSLFVKSIRKQGLLPNAHPFHVGINIDRAVYLTPEKELAVRFALTRTAYERAAAQGHVANLIGFDFTKQTGKAHPNAKPVVVECNLPETWRDVLTSDPDFLSFTHHAYESSQPIPPEYITKIETITEDNNV